MNSQIVCHTHNEPFKFLDLSKASQNRLLCSKCDTASPQNFISNICELKEQNSFDDHLQGFKKVIHWAQMSYSQAMENFNKEMALFQKEVQQQSEELRQMVEARLAERFRINDVLHLYGQTLTKEYKKIIEWLSKNDREWLEYSAAKFSQRYNEIEEIEHKLLEEIDKKTTFEDFSVDMRENITLKIHKIGQKALEEAFGRCDDVNGKNDSDKPVKIIEEGRGNTQDAQTSSISISSNPQAIDFIELLDNSTPRCCGFEQKLRGFIHSNFGSKEISIYNPAKLKRSTVMNCQRRENDKVKAFVHLKNRNQILVETSNGLGVYMIYKGGLKLLKYMGSTFGDQDTFNLLHLEKQKLMVSYEHSQTLCFRNSLNFELTTFANLQEAGLTKMCYVEAINSFVFFSQGYLLVYNRDNKEQYVVDYPDENMNACGLDMYYHEKSKMLFYQVQQGKILVRKLVQNTFEHYKDISIPGGSAGTLKKLARFIPINDEKEILFTNFSNGFYKIDMSNLLISFYGVEEIEKCCDLAVDEVKQQLYLCDAEYQQIIIVDLKNE